MLFSLLKGSAATGSLPSQCEVCRCWADSALCAACVTRYAAPRPRCARCGLGLGVAAPACGACLREPPPYAHTVCVADYGFPWDRLVADFKFHGRAELAGVLAAQVTAAVRADGAALPDTVVPVALSARRLAERGYNQAWELARRLGRVQQCPADARLLLRVRDTPHQLAFPPDQRAGNVRAAFAVEPRRAAELRGRSVALVDDVMTTGATVAEAARVLLQAGAVQVQVWSVARTPRPGEP